MLNTEFELIQGDDYAIADSRALTFYGTGESWPDLTGATFAFNVRKVGDDTACLSITAGTYTAAVGSVPASLQIELTAAQTADLPAEVSGYVYDLHATLATGNRITLARSYISVYADW